jgi:hypothetical protein
MYEDVQCASSATAAREEKEMPYRELSLSNLSTLSQGQIKET